MRITQESDYALRISYLLASDGGILDSGAIAKATGVTERFTVKILRKLTQSGVVVSKKGASGGYRLALAPGDITIRRIVEVIDGPVEISKCLDGNYECSRVGNDKQQCTFHLIFAKINKTIADKLDGVTLDNVIDENFDVNKILSKI